MKMKTQISSLINGSEFTIRNMLAEKYCSNAVDFFNKPKLGGTTVEERTRIAMDVARENPDEMKVRANGVELTLSRNNSLSGKSWSWEAPITREQYAEISGKVAPFWTHAGAVNTYYIRIFMDCTIELHATSGRKGNTVYLGEEFIEIL